MIKISRKNIDNIAIKHYESIENFINKKTRGYTLKDINKEIEKCFNKNWNFKKLILATPEELEKLSKIYKFKCVNNYKYFHTLYDYMNNYEYLYNPSKQKFFYKINGVDKPYNAYELIKLLNISICPYCNRNSIYNIFNEKKRTSELDHFYPQSKYPFFAISFYNLVPSCKVCNKIKLDNDDKKYINPYDIRFDMNQNMKFSLKIKDSSFIHSVNGIGLDYKFSNNIEKDEKCRIENNLEDFKLKDLYDNHKDIVLELIQKREIYPDSYIDDLFHQYEGTLFKNREDVLRHITGGYIEDKDINKRPLSKLIKDISEELDLI